MGCGGLGSCGAATRDCSLCCLLFSSAALLLPAQMVRRMSKERQKKNKKEKKKKKKKKKIPFQSVSYRYDDGIAWNVSDEQLLSAKDEIRMRYQNFVFHSCII